MERISSLRLIITQCCQTYLIPNFDYFMLPLDLYPSNLIFYNTYEEIDRQNLAHQGPPNPHPLAPEIITTAGDSALQPLRQHIFVT